QPLVGVQVQAMRYRYVQGRKQLSTFGQATTNDLGEYRIFGLAADRYFLTATYRANTIVEPAVDRSNDQTIDEDYAPIYYPNSFGVDSAARIAVSPGQELRGIDFALSRTHAVHIRGRVNRASGTVSGLITVRLVPAENAAGLTTNRTYITD